MSETLSLNKLEKLIEPETQLRDEYQQKLDEKDTVIAELTQDKTAVEAKVAELEKTISTQLATIKDMSGKSSDTQALEQRNRELHNRSENMKEEVAVAKNRLKALEAKVAEEGVLLTEAQVQALEKKKLDDEACGEIETSHPGYLGSQDTFYVGPLKGVGRVYQQTYVDTYCKVAHAKLYTTKTPTTAADLLNDRVLPFNEEHDLPVLRILTDRGTEYCGRVHKHDFQLFLAINDIDHTKTKVKSPQTNGICERFHKTILQEFYQITFRKKVYQSIEELQADLDEWLHHYNIERTHQGKMCCGRTPFQTMIEGKEIW